MNAVQTRNARVCDTLKCMARQCWEQGVAAQAMLETGDTQALALMARDCVVRQHEDGRLCCVEDTPAIVDPAICVEPVIAAEMLLDDVPCREAAGKNIAYLLHRAPGTADGARFQLLGTQEVWADSLGMGPHVLIASGYPDEGLAFFDAVKKRLYDEKTGLYRHKWDEARGAFIRPCFWGVGNGWALVGLMRMALALSAAGDRRLRVVTGAFEALVQAMIPLQAQNGLFHDILDDTGSYAETESAMMFAYAVFKLAGRELLSAKYLPAAQKARHAAAGRVDRFGLVRGCAGSPAFDREGTSAEGQSHFLMMEAAAAALERTRAI